MEADTNSQGVTRYRDTLQQKWKGLQAVACRDQTAGAVFQACFEYPYEKNLADAAAKRDEWTWLWAIATEAGDVGVLIGHLSSTARYPEHVSLLAIRQAQRRVEEFFRQVSALEESLAQGPREGVGIQRWGITDLELTEAILVSVGYSLGEGYPSFSGCSNAEVAKLLVESGCIEDPNVFADGYGEFRRSLDEFWWNRRRPEVLIVVSMLSQHCAELLDEPLPAPTTTVALDSLPAFLLAGLPGVWDALQAVAGSVEAQRDNRHEPVIDPMAGWDLLFDAWHRLEAAVTGGSDVTANEALVRMHEVLAHVEAMAGDYVFSRQAEAFPASVESVREQRQDHQRRAVAIRAIAQAKSHLFAARGVHELVSDLVARTTAEGTVAAGWANIQPFPDVDRMLEDFARQLELDPAYVTLNSDQLTRGLGA